jgi:hypothetical protein
MAPVFTTYFTPFGARKGCWNAIMKAGFSDGGFKNRGKLRDRPENWVFPSGAIRDNFASF